MAARYQMLEVGVYDFQTRQIVTRAGTPEQWEEYRAYISGGGIVLKADPIGMMTLEQAKATRVEQINLFCASERNKIIAGRSGGELASWSMKLLDALARSQGQPSPFAPIMAQVATLLHLPITPHGINDAMAMIRGCSEDDYINRVFRDAIQFIAVEIALDAIRGKHCDAIAACETVQDVIAYDWMAGWPKI